MFGMWTCTTPYEQCLAPKSEGQGFSPRRWNLAFWGRSFALFEFICVLLAHFSAYFGRILGSFFGHLC